MANLASINIRYEVDNAGLRSQIEASAKIAKKMGEQLQEAGKSWSTYITAPILALGVASGKLASDLNESANKVDVAFDESAASVEAFSKTTLTSFGIAEGSALDMAALFGDMATGMGLTEAAAAEMSKSLVGLAGDLASFKNKNISEVTTALNGVFTGETESLKMLGIVMTEANLAQFALSQGVTKNIKDFTQAEKVMLRYEYVMAQTTNAQGDFARTGGAAANQTRVFFEGLKEIGAQLGQVILPVFTDLIKHLNGLITEFKMLDPEMQQVIVVSAGVAAAIGPILLGLGSILKLIPTLVAGINAVKAAAAVLSANFAAIAAVVGIAVIAYTAFNDETKELSQSQQTLNNVNEEAVKLVAAQRAEVDKLVKVAKDETASVKERREAITQLNAISPEYLGNLKLETINTDAAAAALERYNSAMLDAAKAKVADSMLNQNRIKQAEVYARHELKLQQQSAKNEEQLSDAQKENFNDIAKMSYETSKVRSAANKELAAALAPLKEEEEILIRVYDRFKAQLGVLEGNSKAASRYNSELSNIKGVDRPKVEAFENPLEAESVGTIGAIDKQIGKLQELQTQVATTTQEYQFLQQQIEGLEIRKQLIIDPTQLIEAQAVVREFANELTFFEQNAEIISRSVGDAFASLGARFVDSLGLAETGFQGFVKNLFNTVTQLIAMMLASSISQSIAGATASGAATGPAAVVTTPAFIATAVSGVLAAFAAIPKFETGGVVGGSSYYGDKILARLNSGELILNRDQQKNILGMINPAVTAADVALQFIGGFEIEGSKLRLVIDRSDKETKRKS